MGTAGILGRLERQFHVKSPQTSDQSAGLRASKKQNALPGRTTPEKASGFFLRQRLCQSGAEGCVEDPRASPIRYGRPQHRSLRGPCQELCAKPPAGTHTAGRLSRAVHTGRFLSSPVRLGEAPRAARWVRDVLAAARTFTPR